jgi:hypothetical protein
LTAEAAKSLTAVVPISSPQHLGVTDVHLANKPISFGGFTGSFRCLNAVKYVLHPIFNPLFLIDNTQIHLLQHLFAILHDLTQESFFR